MPLQYHRGCNGHRIRVSTHTVNPSKENSPAGVWTRNLSITSPVLYQQATLACHPSPSGSYVIPIPQDPTSSPSSRILHHPNPSGSYIIPILQDPILSPSFRILHRPNPSGSYIVPILQDPTSSPSFWILHHHNPSGSNIIIILQDPTSSQSFRILHHHHPSAFHLFHKLSASWGHYNPSSSCNHSNPSVSCNHQNPSAFYHIISICHHPTILEYLVIITLLQTLRGSQDSLFVRAPDSWSKGCRFKSRQERQENFLLQSQLCVLTLIWCLFCVTGVACKRPRSFCQKCVWQLAPKQEHTLGPTKLEWVWLCRCPVWEPARNRLTRNLSGNIWPQSSQLAEPLWTDPGIKSGISARKLIFTSKWINEKINTRRGMNG